jgi:hypothetical protein
VQETSTLSTQAPRHPGTRAFCHLLTGSHGVGSNGAQGFNVTVIDESLTIQDSFTFLLYIPMLYALVFSANHYNQLRTKRNISSYYTIIDSIAIA